MKKQKRQVPQSEAMKARWKRRIVMEKSYPESTAQWMAERLERLLDHMLYGHAMIAYHKQNGDFKFVKGTLIYYEAEFHKAYDPDVYKRQNLPFCQSQITTFPTIDYCMSFFRQFIIKSFCVTSY